MWTRELVEWALSYGEHLRAGLEPRLAEPSPTESVPSSFLDALMARASDLRAPLPELVPGQIWVSDPGEERGVRTLLLVTWAGQPLPRGVVLTTEAWVAADDDLVLRPEASPAQQPLAACLFRDIPFSTHSLVGFVGAITPHAFRPILMLLQDRMTGGFRRETLGTIAAKELGLHARVAPNLLSVRIVDARGQAADYLSGPSITDEDDPRLEPRALLGEATAYLETSALAQLDRGYPNPTPADAAFFARLDRSLVLLERSEGRVLRRPPSIASSSTAMPPRWMMPTAGGAGPAVVAPFRSGYTSSETMSPVADSSERSFEVPLAAARVELSISLEAGQLRVAVFATQRDSGVPQAGVALQVSCEAEGRGRRVLDRVTDLHGTIAGAPLPNWPGARYQIRVQLGDEREVLTW